MRKKVFRMLAAAQMATLTKVGYADYQSAGPISITEGRMTYNTYWGSEDKEVYVVALSGTETIVDNQTTTVKEDLLSGFELSNEYVTNVKNAIIDRIPAGSNIILAGHSLGGMVAQQVAADKNTFYSISSVLNIVWQYAGVNHEDGGYNGDSSAAHCDSYLREDALNQFTTFAIVTDVAPVETEVSEVMEADAEVVEAEAVEESVETESVDTEAEETEVVETEAVAE